MHTKLPHGFDIRCIVVWTLNLFYRVREAKRLSLLLDDSKRMSLQYVVRMSAELLDKLSV